MASQTKLGQLLSKKVKENPNQCLSTDFKILRCDACNKVVNYDAKHGQTFLNKHLRSEKHCSSSQQYLIASLNKQESELVKKNEFNDDLCKFLIAANILLQKVEHAAAKDFFLKYTKFQLPAVSTLRDCYVKNNYDKVREKIKQEIKGKKICLIVDFLFKKY